MFGTYLFYLQLDLASYVVGRYSSGDSQRKLDILMRLFQQVIGTIFVVIVMIVITLLYILIVSQSSSAVVNSFFSFRFVVLGKSCCAVFA